MFKFQLWVLLFYKTMKQYKQEHPPMSILRKIGHPSIPVTKSTISTISMENSWAKEESMFLGKSSYLLCLFLYNDMGWYFYLWGRWNAQAELSTALHCTALHCLCTWPNQAICRGIKFDQNLIRSSGTCILSNLVPGWIKWSSSPHIGFSISIR